MGSRLRTEVFFLVCGITCSLGCSLEEEGTSEVGFDLDGLNLVVSCFDSLGRVDTSDVSLDLDGVDTVCSCLG